MLKYTSYKNVLVVNNSYISCTTLVMFRECFMYIFYLNSSKTIFKLLFKFKINIYVPYSERKHIFSNLNILIKS